MNAIASIPADAPKNEHGVPACPECGKFDFKKRAGLGSHRKNEHGVPASSPSYLRYKAKRKKAQTKRHVGRPGGSKNGSAAQISIDKTQTVCTYCNPPQEMKNYLGLRIHLAQSHGIKGVTHLPAAERRKLVAQENSNAVTLLPTTKVKRHDISNGHSPEISRSTEPPLTAEDLLVFQTAGELKGYCRSVAESAGLPTPQFTARIILALHNQTRR